jgi:exodeoxyribonuclease VII large subunit
VSPLRTLERGYAIVTANNHVITNAVTLKPGDRIKARLADGSLDAIVEHIDPNKPATRKNE